MRPNCKWRLRMIAPISVLSAAMPVWAQSAQWRIAGHDLSNTRSQPAETLISPANVSKLTMKWVFTTGGDVSATPTVANGVVYFPDWGGNLYAVNTSTGKKIWSHQISDYDGFAGAVSRGSPAIDGGSLIIGDLESYTQNHNGANVISVNASTGALQWITQVENHPAAIITGSPVVYNGVVYLGVSSVEETLGENPTYACCSFRGSVVALDERNGEILWKTYDMPDNGGSTDQYSGGAVWQPPVIDPDRGLLYIGTGNGSHQMGESPARLRYLDHRLPSSHRRHKSKLPRCKQPRFRPRRIRGQLLRHHDRVRPEERHLLGAESG
jgi:polyvinyl alcohol dehydrogenase (cytochrome)